MCGNENDLTNITVAIDKLDKIGIEKVNEELKQRGIDEKGIEKINEYLTIAKEDLSNQEILSALQHMFEHHAIGLAGIAELTYVCDNCDYIYIDVSLARGLNYYTGSIIEVKPEGIQLGSIGGGGRYDDLTGLFGVKDIAGVGISFGVDRIYDALEELNLFPSNTHNSLQVMLVNFGMEYETMNKKVLQQLRAKNISCELYPEAIKFDKQLKYANKRQVNYIGMIGEDELKEGKISIKNFMTGEQKVVDVNEIELH
jgi:histidyl-tRNA synthetase